MCQSLSKLWRARDQPAHLGQWSVEQISKAERDKSLAHLLT